MFRSISSVSSGWARFTANAAKICTKKQPCFQIFPARNFVAGDCGNIPLHFLNTKEITGNTNVVVRALSTGGQPSLNLQQVSSNQGGEAEGLVGTKSTSQDDDGQQQQQHKAKAAMFSAMSAVCASIGFGFYWKQKTSSCAEKEILAEVTFETDEDTGFSDAPMPGIRKRGLPDYRRSDIESHQGQDGKQWVTYMEGVYDITEFVKSHPGGKQILLAAGGQLEPFWELYSFHKNSHVFEQLELLRIGNVDPRDVEELRRCGSKKVADDPFCRDPERSPTLLVNSARPFDGEPHSQMLVQNFITPNELFFVRNHFPVPEENKSGENNIMLTTDKNEPIMPLSVPDLKKQFQEHTITTTIQCAGNRRKEMHEHKPVRGLSSGIGAISTAEWTGVKLSDVLKKAGLKEEDYKHVLFQGGDKDMEGLAYEASIPSETAFDPSRDVLLAYEMNGQSLPRDHGAPLRLVVPGTVGARQVKWLRKIIVSEEESKSHYQQRDYKGFNSTVDWSTVDWSRSPAIQEYPVQSAVCDPTEGAVLDDSEELTVRGYAWSGGGRGIIRVDVSVDGGLTWTEAELHGIQQKLHRRWAWTLWEVSVPVPEKHHGQISIVCKATDSSYNSQPEKTEAIWNLGGFLQNAWHRIVVTVPEAEAEE